MFAAAAVAIGKSRDDYWSCSVLATGETAEIDGHTFFLHRLYIPNNEIAAGLDYLTKDRIRAKLHGRLDDYGRELIATIDGWSDAVAITRAGNVYLDRL